MEDNRFGARIYNQVNMFVFEDGFPVNDYLITLDRNHFSCIFVNKVFDPGAQYTGCQFASHIFLQAGLAYLYLISQVKDLKDVLVAFKTNGSEQCSDRQFLFPVNVSVHYVVNICRELNP